MFMLARSYSLHSHLHKCRLHQRPLTLKEAVDRVQSWFEQPCVRIIQPTEQHWDIFRQMLRDGSATAISSPMHILPRWRWSTIASSAPPMRISRDSPN